jgi:hypothetical protein
MMRAIEITHADDHRVLVRVQHRKFFVDWIEDYEGELTIFAGVYCWRLRISKREVRSMVMNRFLDDAVRKEN